MIHFKSLNFFDGIQRELNIESEHDQLIDAAHLLAIPAVIDPHVHFRTPGMEYKEDWCSGANAALRGGCTMVFDMPNTLPPTITAELLRDKKNLIDSQLARVRLPLRYELFFGADKNHLSEITLVKNQVIGIKVFMGCSTGNLVIDDDESLHAVFELAAQENMLVAVHAEDERILCAQKKHYHDAKDYATHSLVRSIDAATTAVAKAIALCKRYGTRLYILHVSSKEEIALIADAKRENLPVFAETTPHHLFLNTHAYERLQGKAVVNPPLRTENHQAHLFAAIHDGTIDTIGSDHAPHTLEEKNKPYGQCPSGMPGIEFMLPLLLNAHHHNQLSLAEIVALTSARAKHIFNLNMDDEWVLVDLKAQTRVTETASKCGWTPYAGMTLQGKIKYVVTAKQLVSINL